jgi:peptide/nickel transport system ATP-binding protein
MSDDILLAVEDLVVEYKSPAGMVQAVSGVSLDLHRGETLGLVGESGCGKSSLARAIMMAPRPTAGSLVFDGRDILKLRRNELRALRPLMQMIFQDPASSLNPFRRARDIVREGGQIWGRSIGDEDLSRLLESVGLDPVVVAERRPSQLSGGQCQRLAIARALVLEPELIVCDEPVSALDVSVQAQILNLLHGLKERYGLTLLFISHDMGVVKNISDRVAVMYLGKLCEVAPVDALFSTPTHPYTHALLASIPEPDPEIDLVRAPIGGDVPSPIDPPSGCRFRTRCPHAAAVCADEVPELRSIDGDHLVACHFPLTSVGVSMGQRTSQ